MAATIIAAAISAGLAIINQRKPSRVKSFKVCKNLFLYPKKSRGRHSRRMTIDALRSMVMRKKIDAFRKIDAFYTFNAIK